MPDLDALNTELQELVNTVVLDQLRFEGTILGKCNQLADAIGDITGEHRDDILEDAFELVVIPRGDLHRERGHP